MQHRVAARGVDLLCGGRLSAVLLQLQDGTAAENADRKLCARIKSRSSNSRGAVHGVCSVVSSPPPGSRERSGWHRPPPTRESDRHIQRGWPAEVMETLERHRRHARRTQKAVTHHLGVLH